MSAPGPPAGPPPRERSTHQLRPVAPSAPTSSSSAADTTASPPPPTSPPRARASSCSNGSTASAAPRSRRRAFPGVDARLSRYSYLVSLLPQAIIRDLKLDIRLARRRYSSYTPLPGHRHRSARRHRRPGRRPRPRSRRSARRRMPPPGSASTRAPSASPARSSRRVTEPLATRSEARRLVGDDALVGRPHREPDRRGHRAGLRRRPGARGRADRRAHRHVRPEHRRDAWPATAASCTT